MKKVITLTILLVGFLFSGTVKTEFVNAQDKAESNGKSNESAIYERIEALTGAKGKHDEKEGVFKVSFPRSDIQVKSSGVGITPPMGLTVWAAFKMMQNHTMMMGDMVLLEDQVNPVMSVALDNGLEVTALHNHFFWDSPKVMFMHIGGTGNPEALATAVGKVFSKIKETSNGKGEKPFFEIDPSKTSFDPKKIDEILGKSGKMTDGVYKIIIGRITQMGGHEMGNAMGVNTWAAFIGSDEKALVDGDFAMLETELQSVLKALRQAGVNIVAIHNHMTMESPRIIFLHYWGIDSTVNLAKGLKAALETQQK